MVILCVRRGGGRLGGIGSLLGGGLGGGRRRGQGPGMGSYEDESNAALLVKSVMAGRRGKTRMEVEQSGTQ